MIAQIWKARITPRSKTTFPLASTILEPFVLKIPLDMVLEYKGEIHRIGRNGRHVDWFED